MISVFTPSHDARFLDLCYESLVRQTEDDWEWCVLLNNGATWDGWHDTRVRVKDAGEVSGVGEAKRLAVEMTSGEILVELDHDDVLRPDALAWILKAFDAEPRPALVYSDFRQIDMDGSPNLDKFDLRHGWEYGADGTCFGMTATPHNVSYIWYAPNHVRAFRRDAYDQAGGYDASLPVCDDQDLMSRLYRVGPFVHIPECLYLQRMGTNTQRDPATNAEIQTRTVELYDRDIEPNALAWAKRMGLKALDLGGVPNPRPGYLIVDKIAHGADLHGDIFDVLAGLPDRSCGVIRASDFLEHIPDKIRLMNELWRVLAHGGLLLSLTPSTDGRGAYQDPTHVSYWNENSFWYYTDASFQHYVPEIEARFQVSRLFTYEPTDWHREHKIPYVCANLIALHGGPRQGGLLYW